MFIYYCFHRVLALTMLLFLFPLMLATAVAIKCFMGGPVFFKQTRAGLHGKKFIIYKFRTMNDHQNIPFLGHILRCLGLDELPQLLNILKGDMNLVGPRPLIYSDLDFTHDRQKKRLHVLPGITGWAQIHGRNHLSLEDKLALDLWYVQHRSLWLDIKIIIKTIPIFLSCFAKDKKGYLPPTT